LNITGNAADIGGGIYFQGEHINLQNSLITGNAAGNGGGVYFSANDFNLQNVLITNNQAGGFGGGIYMGDYINGSLQNVSLVNNTAAGWGGGIACVGISSVDISNSIVYYNEADNGSSIYLSQSAASISFSDIQGGWDGVGNIDEEPLFTGAGSNPFALSYDSPCVDAGTSDTSGMNLPMFDIIGSPRIWNNRIDMGAYEWNNVGMDEIIIQNPKFRIHNYPNPFNTSITIAYELPEPGQVEIIIFNQLGQLIEKLSCGYQHKGKHQFTWDASTLPNGIYFIQMRAGQEVAIGKIIKMRYNQ